MPNIYNQPSIRNYNNVGTRNNGFQYKILPLSFNLLQKGNDISSKEFNKCKLNIGTYVSGYDINDKEHYGDIIRLKINVHNKISRVYILDDVTRKVVSLVPETVVVKKKKITEKFGFDKSVNESLFDDEIFNDSDNEDEVTSDIEAAYNRKLVDNTADIIEALFVRTVFDGLYRVEHTKDTILVINKRNPSMIIMRVDMGISYNVIDRITFYKISGSILLWLLFLLIYLLPVKIKHVVFEQRLLLSTNLNYRTRLNISMNNMLTEEESHSLNIDRSVKQINSIYINNDFIEKIPHITFTVEPYIQLGFEGIKAESIDVYKAFIKKLHLYNIDSKYSDGFVNNECVDEFLNCYSYILGPVDKESDKLHTIYIYGDMTPRLIKQEIEEISQLYNIDK